MDDIEVILSILAGKSDKETIEFLQEEKLIRKCGVCPNCHVQRRLVQNKHYKGGYGARCPRCRKFSKLIEGTFFEDTRISFHRILIFMYLWCAGLGQKEAGDILGFTSQHTKVDYYNFFRDICSHHISTTPGLFQFGGPGVVVQVDESVITKRKYNRGRVVPEVWILGIYDTLLKRGVIEYVEHRDADTLTEVIRRHVAPGTIIYTDGWAAYRRLAQLGYIHRTVNHSANFVDPVTGICTNAVEGYWARLKIWLRRHGVMHSNLLPSHIDEFMWRDVYANGPVKETFSNFIRHIKNKYPLP